MSFKITILSACAGCLLMASPAFALTSDPMPTNNKGVALADPDEKSDNMTTTKDGVTTFNFGGDDSSGSNSGSGLSFSVSHSDPGNTNPPASAQTGDQMFDPSVPMTARH